MGITPFIKKNSQQFVGAPRAFLARLVPTTGRRRTADRTDSRSGAPASELEVGTPYSFDGFIYNLYSFM